jgi:hypothetical protein
METLPQQETIIKSNKTKSSVILIASNKISTIWELFTFINHNMFESNFIFSIIEKNTIKMQIFVPHISSSFLLFKSHRNNFQFSFSLFAYLCFFQFMLFFHMKRDDVNNVLNAIRTAVNEMKLIAISTHKTKLFHFRWMRMIK